MSSDPQVTVLVLTYNDQNLVPRAIESVLKQSYSRFKLKILDNGSTDGTQEVLKKYRQDPRVEILTNKVNQRSEFACREALNTQTNYLSFLFSDDMYMPDRLKKMIAVLEHDPSLDAVFASNLLVDENGKDLERIPTTVFGGDVSSLSQDEHLQHFFLRGNSLHPCGMVIRTGTYKKLGGFKTYLHRLGDMTFFARLLAAGKVAFMPDKLQKITVLSSDRNESFTNAINKTGIAFERTQFLSEYASPAMLTKIKKILPNTAEISSLGETESLFALGSEALNIPAEDYQLFGVNCLYQSYDRAPEKIDAVCESQFGTSFAQHLWNLQSRHLTQAKVALFKLRRGLMSLPGGTLLISALRPSVRALKQAFRN